MISRFYVKVLWGGFLLVAGSIVFSGYYGLTTMSVAVAFLTAWIGLGGSFVVRERFAWMQSRQAETNLIVALASEVVSARSSLRAVLSDCEVRLSEKRVPGMPLPAPSRAFFTAYAAQIHRLQDTQLVKEIVDFYGEIDRLHQFRDNVTFGNAWRQQGLTPTTRVQEARRFVHMLSRALAAGVDLEDALRHARPDRISERKQEAKESLGQVLRVTRLIHTEQGSDPVEFLPGDWTLGKDIVKRIEDRTIHVSEHPRGGDR